MKLQIKFMTPTQHNAYPKGRFSTPTDAIKDQETLEEAHIRRNEQAEKKALENFERVAEIDTAPAEEGKSNANKSFAPIRSSIGTTLVSED